MPRSHAMASIRDEITKTVLRFTGRKNVPSREASPPSTVLRTGRQFSSYRILKRLGAGGMGQVYLALDTRLGRHVALKFLPPELTSDIAMFHRLEQEARTASALNHPNILTIYEIGQAEGERFIASEFVEGTTLSHAINRGVVDRNTALDIASQVASALVAAHAAGIVHRDVKPANIMIRPDGYVKVIDFGIAKLTEASRHRGVPELSRTRPGSVIGTVDYMSPEQARGDDVDHRTDLWSLGVILYEMLTLQNPFEGATESHIIVNILDKATPDLSNQAEMTPELARVIQLALTKDRERRYQSAYQMLADLQGVRQTATTLIAPRPIAQVKRPGRKSAHWNGTVALVASAGAVLAVGLAIWWLLLGGQENVFGPDWFRVAGTPRQLTYNGRTKLAAISPDGKYLAYVVGDTGGGATLFLKQIDHASEEVKIPSRKVVYLGVTFSPDSQTVYAVQQNEALIGHLYAVPIVGELRDSPFLVDIDGPVSFSPSGDQFSFVRYSHPNPAKSESLVEIAERDGSGQRTLLSLESALLFRQLTWSPNGKSIAGVLYNYTGHAARADLMLNLVDMQGRQTRKPLIGWTSAFQPCWTAGSRSVILSGAVGAEGSNQAQLREISVNTGEVRQLTHDLAGYRSASITRDSQQLAAVKIESKSSLWASQTKNFTRGTSLPAEAATRPILSWVDGSRVLLNSQSGGYPNFLQFDLQTHKRTILTSEPHVEEDAAVVPGTRVFVFSSNRSGQFHIWKYDSDSNTYSQLTFGAGYDQSPAVSSDGKWIVYINWLADNPHLRRLSVAGGPSVPIGTFLAREPQISPDGQWIAAQIHQGPDTANWTVSLINVNNPNEIQRVPNAKLPFRWAPDGKSLTSVFTDEGVSNLWAVPFDNSPPRKLTSFDDETIQTLAWSPAGDRVSCIRAAEGSDAVLYRRQAK